MPFISSKITGLKHILLLTIPQNIMSVGRLKILNNLFYISYLLIVCILRHQADTGAFNDGQRAFPSDRQNDIIPRCS